MTTLHHDAIASGANADDTVVNSPLSQLDSALVQGELYGSLSILTLSGGVVTLTGGWHAIAAETGTTDDLDTITQAVGALTPQTIVIQADTGDTIAVKHSTGNIELAGAVDVSLSGNDRMVLFYDGTNWADIVVSTAAAPAGNVDIGARVYNSASQSITGGVDTELTFDSEDYDTDGIHDTVTNSSRLTAKTAGKYLIVGNVRWTASMSGLNVALNILHNGTTLIGENDDDVFSGRRRWLVLMVYDMALNDYVELQVGHDSGSAKSVGRYADYSPIFAMQLLA